jgi:hypothetical protein
MYRSTIAALLGLVFLVTGCSSKPDERQVSTRGSVQKHDLLEPLLLKSKPADVKSVNDIVKTGAPGDEVVVTGQIPPGNIKPFNESRAVFFLMSPQDLAEESVQNEFACEEAATCPACRKILDDRAVRVELLGANGTAPLSTTVEGFRGIGPGSTITVKGKLDRQGKALVLRGNGLMVE